MITWCISKRSDSDSCKKHSENLRIGFWILIGIITNQRLKNRRRQLKTKRNDSDLSHRKIKLLLQLWINCRNYGLQQIVEQVCNCNCKKNRIRCFSLILTHYFFCNIPLILLSFIKASTGVKVFISKFRISDLISSRRGSSRLKKESCKSSFVGLIFSEEWSFSSCFNIF